jgi:hypothetical protein
MDVEESIGIGYSSGVCRETEGGRTCLQIEYSYGVCEKKFSVEIDGLRFELEK